MDVEYIYVYRMGTTDAVDVGFICVMVQVVEIDDVRLSGLGVDLSDTS